MSNETYLILAAIAYLPVAALLLYYLPNESGTCGHCNATVGPDQLDCADCRALYGL